MELITEWSYEDLRRGDYVRCDSANERYRAIYDLYQHGVQTKSVSRKEMSGWWLLVTGRRPK